MRKFRRVLFLKLARMMRGEKNIVPCIISAGTRIVGNITDGDVIHIDGRLDGDVSCRELVIGSTGAVTGKIQAKSLELYGELNGSLAVENLFIAGTARFICMWKESLPTRLWRNRPQAAKRITRCGTRSCCGREINIP